MSRFSILSIFFYLCIIGCNLDIDTVTPQASSSIEASRKDNFYLSAMKKIHSGDLDIIDSVWSEKVWQYKIISGKRMKVLLEGKQVILKLKKYQNGFNKKDYQIDWIIDEKGHGTLGSGNGVFILMYSNDLKSDTLHFFLRSLSNNSTTDIGKFLVQ